MKIDYFDSIDLFASLSQKSLEKLSVSAKRHFYKKSAIILDNQQASQTFLYVIHGWIKIFRESAEGDEIILDVLTTHHYCGELFLFESIGECYMAQAVSDIEVIALPIVLLKELILSDNQLSLNFMRSILKKQQQLNAHVEHLSIQSAVERIGCFLLRLCYGAQDNQAVLHFPYDKVLLASRLGMRSETFSRALKKLYTECQIDAQGDKIQIHDIQALASYVCHHCSRVFPCGN